MSDDEIKAASELLDDSCVVEKLRLPSDVMVAEEFADDSRWIEASADSVPESGFILDIGFADDCCLCRCDFVGT